MTRLGWMIGFLALAGCAEGEGRAAADAQERASTYTKLDDAHCGPENVIEETGDWDRRCKGAAGQEFEWASGDLREELLLIRGAKSINLDIPVKVAGGAFNSLGPTLEWRGPEGGAPDVLIVRVQVADAEGKNDSGRLAVVRLGDAPCIVAVVPPGAGQNERARALADGKLPDCLAAAD